MQENNFELIKSDPGVVGEGQLTPPISDNSLLALAETAEKRLEAMNKIKNIALKLTNASDWVDENGKPYLQASGAEKVARLFGVSWRIGEPVFEQLEMGHFSYTYKGEFASGGAAIEAIGTRTSKDGFFKKYRYEDQGPDKKAKKIELPPSEIDKGDVKKAAFTNLLVNGITRLLGLRNLTYDDLAEFAGIKREHVQGIQYKKEGKSAPPPKTTQRQQQQSATKSDTTKAGSLSDAPCTDTQCNAIAALLDKLNIEDFRARMEKVAEIVGLKDVPTSLTKLTNTQAAKAIDVLQKEDSNDSGANTQGQAE